MITNRLCIKQILSNYCLKCRANAESKNPTVAKTKTRRIMIWSKSAVCDSTQLKFIKEQELTRLLSSLGVRKHLSKITLVGVLLFKRYLKVNTRHKILTTNKILLPGGKFMP